MEPGNSKDKKMISIWLMSGCILIYLMVVLGGITRLTHSGLSMVQWKPISGAIPPLNEKDWQQEFQHYKTSPEYKEINTGFSMQDFKSIFFWEYLHRLIGRIIGVVFLLPFFYFLLAHKLTKALILRGIFLFILGGLQGLLGWYMVKSGLIKNPHVSHYRLAAHLLSAFTVFGFTFWFVLELNEPSVSNKLEGRRGLMRAGIFLFCIVIIQIAFGAFTAGLKAGYAYNTYPLMNGKWLPMQDLYITPFYKNFLESNAGVQFIHRWLAMIVVICVTWIWWKVKKIKTQSSRLQLISVDMLLACVCIQFLLGLFTLLFAVPVVLGVLHQTGAFFLFSACLFYLFQFRKTVQRLR